MNAIKDKTQYLPLTGGVFGEALNNCLEKRKGQKEQLNDLLPELGRDRKRKADYGNSKANWHTGNKNSNHNAGDRSVRNANNYRNFPSARSYDANNKPSNGGKQKDFKDTNKSKTKEFNKMNKKPKTVQSGWGSLQIPRKSDS